MWIYGNFLGISPEKLVHVWVGTLPETNIAHENPIFPGKSHQNGGFSMAMYLLVYRSVIEM